MRTVRTDVVVIGAGPAGSTTARLCAEGGLSVVVLEEHDRVGLPIQCAGLISTRIDEVNDLPDDVVVNTVRGAHMWSPGGVGITVARPEPQAYVIDRAAFDANLSDLAQEAGAELVLGARVRWMGPGYVRTTDAAYRSRYVVCCEGFTSRLPRGVGLDTTRELLAARQVRIRTTGLDTDHVSMFFGREVAPGFFGWIIPESGEVARVGVACRGGQVNARLRAILHGRLGPHRIIEQGGGVIPISGPVRRTHEGGLLVVGDAAGQVKATTGGGIVVGSICAAAAAEALITGDPASYERLWRSRVERELAMCLRIRRFVDDLDDIELDSFFTILKDSGAENTIEQWGDMDFPSALVARLALNPSVVTFAARRLADLRRRHPLF